jgi:hypothetical protein
MASPLPQTRPNSGRSEDWSKTSAPQARAMSPVPSVESSTTTTWSITSCSSNGTRSRRIAPIVPASFRAGRQTEIEASRSTATRPAGKAE